MGRDLRRKVGIPAGDLLGFKPHCVMFLVGHGGEKLLQVALCEVSRFHESIITEERPATREPHPQILGAKSLTARLSARPLYKLLLRGSSSGGEGDRG